MERLQRWLPTFLLVLLPLLIVGRHVVSGHAPVDVRPFVQELHDPYIPETPYDILQADGALQFAPWRSIVFRSWSNGDVPFWNPHQLAGIPLLSNGQSGGLYPFHILFGILGIETGLAMSLLAWLHLAIAGLGVAALCRQLGCGTRSAVLAGALFGLSSFLTAWLPLASVGTTCAWIPWVLVGVARVHSAPRSLRTGVWLAIATAMMLLGGHLQFAFYGVLAAVLLALTLFITNKPERLRSVALTAAALTIGACLAAPQLLPVLEASKSSHRRTVATAEGYSAYTASAIKPYELVGAVAPGFLGSPSKWAVAEPDPDDPTATPDRSPSSWTASAKPGGNYAEAMLSFGPVVILGLFLLKRRSFTGTTLGIGIIGGFFTLLALGTPLNALLYFGIPGFASTGSPGRAAVVAVMAAACLAGIGFSRILDSPSPQTEAKGDEDPQPSDLSSSTEAKPSASFLTPERLRDAWPSLALIGVVLATILVMNSLTGLTSWTGQPIGWIIARQMLDVLPLVVLSTALAIAALLVAKGRFITVAPLMLLVAQIVVLQPNVVPSSKLPEFTAPDPNIRTANFVERWSFFSPPTGTPPNIATLVGQNEVGGYDSLVPLKSVEMIQYLNGGVNPSPPENGNVMLMKGWDAQTVERLGEAGVSAVRHNGTAAVFPQGSVVTFDGGTAEILEASTQGATIRTSGDAGRLTVRYVNLPGWEAKIDGETVPISGDTWIELEVPAGDSQVSLIFVPEGYKAGLMLFAFGLVLILCTAFSDRVRGAKPSGQNSPLS